MIGQQGRFARRRGRAAALGLAAAWALVACGGGGGGGDAAPAPVPPAPPVPSGVTLTGKVMLGYLQGASVCLDTNDNLRCDAGELVASTDAQGDYRLEVKAEQLAALAAARLVAVVPADAVDASTGAPVGSEHVLLSRPYDPATTVYPFTPLRTRAEQIVWGGAARADAEAEVRHTAGLLDLGLDDDYLGAAAQAHVDEAAAVREVAKTWFGQQTRELMGLMHQPSAAYFNAQGDAGVFEMEASNGSDGVVYAVKAGHLGAAGASVDKRLSRRSWTFDPVTDTGFQAYTPYETRSDFLDQAQGWLDGDSTGTLAQRLDGGRVLHLRSGVPVAAELRDETDLSGRVIGRDEVGGNADLVTSGSYPDGARRFLNRALVQWRTGGYAEPYEEGQAFGMTMSSLEEFIARRQLQPDGSGSWRPLRGLETSAVEMGFDGQGGVVFRGASSLLPMGTTPLEFITFGGERVLRVPLSDPASLAEFGQTGLSLYFAAHHGVHALAMLDAGHIDIGADTAAGGMSGGRRLNRVALDALAQALALPAVPVPDWAVP